MSREIQCEDCLKPMGEIRDATLRKGIIHICTPCNITRGKIKKRLTALELMQKTGHKPDLFEGGLFGDVFDDIFGKR